MAAKHLKRTRLQRRKWRIRKKVFGTAERPRLSVSRAHRNISAQIINDETGVTICQASTMNKDLREQIEYGGNIKAAGRIGEVLAERAAAHNITTVTLDRNGCKYHGRVKSLAEGARKGGLEF